MILFLIGFKYDIFCHKHILFSLQSLYNLKYMYIQG